MTKHSPKAAKKQVTKPSLPPPDKVMQLDEALEDLAKQLTKKEEKIRDRLLKLVDERKIELFHDASYESYAVIPVDTHIETHKIKGGGFKRWLRSAYYQDCEKGISAQVLTDTLETLDAKAICTGPEYKVFTRVAHVDGQIYIDLCNEKHQVIHITENGWDIVDRSPVRFIRSQGMLPQVMPIKGGKASEKIGKLRGFINAGDDDNWRLIVAWILGAFSPGPYTVLVTLGEQGCSKTFLCKICRSVVDPSEIPLVITVKESRDIVIAAQNSHVLGLDNLSKLPDWLSDLLCSVATGAAHRERKYHTNSGDEVLFKARAPIILNGIDFAMRGDLLDRSLLVSLSSIDDSDRINESELLPQIEQAMPEIFGGVCDVLASILKNLPTTKLKSKPRMADFASGITAAESCLGWEPGDFMRTYTKNRKDAIDLTIDSDSFGAALRVFMENRTDWSGNWKQLIGALAGNNDVPKDWPKNGKGVAGVMKRLRPAMRKIDIIYEDAKHQRTGSIYFIHRNPSQLSQLSQANFDEALYSDRCVTDAPDSDGYSKPVTDSISSQTPTVTLKTAAGKAGGECDTCDISLSINNTDMSGLALSIFDGKVVE